MWRSESLNTVRQFAIILVAVICVCCFLPSKRSRIEKLEKKLLRFVVNLNRGSTDELDLLPGVGPGLAGRIVEERPYSNVEGLLRIRGIGPKTFGRIAPMLTVEE